MREAFSSLRARPRPFFACVAMVVIAVSAMVVIPALTNSASAKLLADLDSLGSNAFIVAPRSTDGGARLPGGALARSSDLVGNDGAIYVVQTTVNARYSSEDPANHGVGVIGVDGTPDNDALRAVDGTYRPVPGYNFGVLGKDAATTLGISSFPTTLVAGGVEVQVTGTVAGDPLVPNMASSLIVDTRTALTIDPSNATDSLIVRLAAGTDEERIAHAVDPTGVRSLAVTQPEALVAARSQSTSTLGGLAVLAAGVAFAVAALGIAIMLTSSVRQRTAEVAVRRVHGASTGQVLRLILTEGLLLGFCGGLMGLVVSNVAISSVVAANSWPSVPSGNLQGVAAVSAVLVCLVAALPPTLVAVRVQPSRAFAVE